MALMMGAVSSLKVGEFLKDSAAQHRTLPHVLACQVLTKKSHSFNVNVSQVAYFLCVNTRVKGHVSSTVQMRKKM
jgi:hypothetical protein